jgi:GTP1/Obg family GTP-binding protein
MNLEKIAQALRDLADAITDQSGMSVDPRQLNLFEHTNEEDQVEAKTVAAQPKINAPSAEELKAMLLAASKAHGRQKVIEIVGEQKVADMSDERRAEVAQQVAAL